MLRVSFALIIAVLVAACASPGDGSSSRGAQALVGEPVIAHLGIGGVT